MVHRADDEPTGAVAAAVIEAEAALVVRRWGERRERSVIGIEQRQAGAKCDHQASVVHEGKAADPCRHLPRQGAAAGRLERAQRRRAHVDPVQALALLVPSRALAIDGLGSVDHNGARVGVHSLLPRKRQGVARNQGRRAPVCRKYIMS